MPADSNPGNSIFGRDRRRSRRHLVHTPAYANLSGSAQGTVLELCEILDINEYGACIQASSPMKVNRLLPLCLDLSVTGAKVHVVGHVVWSDPSGRTGIRFPDMSEASRAQLRDWLEANAKHAPKTAAPAPSAEGPVPQPEPHVQSRPTHAVAYTSLVNEWTEIEKEVELCGPDLDPALHLIAQRALTLTWASGTAIALINRRRPSEMICRARAGTDSPEIGARLEAGSGFSGQCVQSGTSVTCDDTESDSRVDPANCRALGIRSMAACPVKRGSEVIGILEVFSSEPAAFWENDITILQKLAGFVANAVRRAEHAQPDVLSLPSGEDNEAESTGAPLFGPTALPEIFPRPMSFRRKALLLLTGIFCITAVIWLAAPWIASSGSPQSQFEMPSAQADSSEETFATTNINDLKRLADQGDAAAEYALAKRYVNGDGVKQDYHEARHWFLQAAQQGHLRAQSKLAASFWEGRGGSRDYAKAYFWALLAQAGGDETAAAIVMSCAPHLSPAQTAAEQKAAEQWLHSHNIGHPE
ncbi:MAG TPA: GAF domain-containing protein [Terriglobales bacterium]